MDFIANHYQRMQWQVLWTNNVWEVRACNKGLKACHEEYCVSIQDDMIVDYLNWDKRLIIPFQMWYDVFAVTSLCAVNLGSDGYHLAWYDAVNDHNSPRNKFVIRDVVNRGPLMFRKSMLEELGYLDEAFAPQGMDDMDICLRAWQHGWVSGVYPMPAFFDPADGTTRKDPNSQQVTQAAWIKNEKILLERHMAAIVGSKHSEDRLLEA